MAAANVSPDVLSQMVEQQLTELLRDTSFRSANHLEGFGQAERERLDWVEGRMANLLADGSLSGAAESGYWLNGASVINGTVTADKLVVNTLEAITTNTGDLNVTGTVTVASAYPATGARITMDSTNGFRLYVGATDTALRFNMDGSGEIGPNGGSKISWDTTPTISIPAAVITSLTIADVGSGTMGGTYQTSSGTTRIDLSTAGMVVYASGNETFKLDAATGAVTATGSYTVQSAASGARVIISSAGGIEGQNASSVTTFLLNAADGAGQLGTGTVTWDSAGTVTINGSVLVAGSVTASKVSVPNLEAFSADLGNILAGTIDASSVTISNLSATTITTGTLVADRISGGSVGGDFSLGTSDITVNSTGQLKFGSGDYLSNNILHFGVTASESAKVEFTNTTYPSYYSELRARASSLDSLINAQAYRSASQYAQTYAQVGALTGADGLARIQASSTAGGISSLTVYSQSTTSEAYLLLGGNRVAEWKPTNRTTGLYGYLYPGSGSATQTQFDIRYDSNLGTTGKSGIIFNEASGWAGLDQDGRFIASANIFPGGQITRYMTDNGTDIGFNFGTVYTTGLGNWSSKTLANAGYFKQLVNGTVRRVPFWADA